MAHYMLFARREGTDKPMQMVTAQGLMEDSEVPMYTHTNAVRVEEILRGQGFEVERRECPKSPLSLDHVLGYSPGTSDSGDSGGDNWDLHPR